MQNARAGCTSAVTGLDEEIERMEAEIEKRSKVHWEIQDRKRREDPEGTEGLKECLEEEKELRRLRKDQELRKEKRDRPEGPRTEVAPNPSPILDFRIELVHGLVQERLEGDKYESANEEVSRSFSPPQRKLWFHNRNPRKNPREKPIKDGGGNSSSSFTRAIAGNDSVRGGLRVV